MKYSVILLLLAALAAAGCAQTQDQSALQTKCAAGDQASCAELAQAQRAHDLQAMRSPIPSPATAIGSAGH